MSERSPTQSDGFVLVEALVAIAILSAVAGIAYAASLAVSKRGEEDLDRLALLSSLGATTRIVAILGPRSRELLPAVDGPYRLSLRSSEVADGTPANLMRGMAIVRVSIASKASAFADAPAFLGN